MIKLLAVARIKMHHCSKMESKQVELKQTPVRIEMGVPVAVNLLLVVIGHLFSNETQNPKWNW